MFRVNFFYFIFVVFILSGCAVNNKNIRKNEKQVLNNNNNNFVVFNEQDNVSPDYFIEEKLPTSDLLLNSIVKFSLKYPTKVLADDVNDIACSDGKLVYLTNSRLLIQSGKCGSLILEKKYKQIQFSFPYVLAYNKNFFEIFDINLCGSITRKSIQFDNVKLIPPYIYFYYKNNIFAVNFFTGKKQFKRKLQNEVMFVGGNKNFVFTVDSNGMFILFDVMSNEPVFEENLNENIIQWNSVGFNFYGINDKCELIVYTLLWEKNKFTLKKEVVDRQEHKTNCILSSNSFDMLCDNMILGRNRLRIENLFEKTCILYPYLYGIKDNNLLAVKIDKPLYIKSVDLNKDDNYFCVSDGHLYFKDFDGKIKYYDFNKNKLFLSEFPDNCSKANIVNGIISISDNKSYLFSELIKSSDNITLYKRIVGDDVYFYYKHIR